MTLEHIKTRIAHIKSTRDDDEHAHCEEDQLRKEFIDYVRVAPNDPQLAEKAALVLSTTNLDFARWCA